MTHLTETEAEKVGAMAEREPGVQEMLSGYLSFINHRPRLISLLYDIDMLPEQTVTRAGAMRLVGLCEVWRMGEAGELLDGAEVNGEWAAPKGEA